MSTLHSFTEAIQLYFTLSVEKLCHLLIQPLTTAVSPQCCVSAGERSGCSDGAPAKYCVWGQGGGLVLVEHFYPAKKTLSVIARSKS